MEQSNYVHSSEINNLQDQSPLIEEQQLAIQSVRELLASIRVRDPASIPSRPAALGAKSLGNYKGRRG